MKKVILLALMAIVSVSAAFAQKSNNTEAMVMIQTNASKNCASCATRFEQNVPFFKGVKSYTYDKATAKLSIKYDPNKTNPDALRKEISKMGYNADNVAADAAARDKLPACCRGEGSCSHAEGQHKCQGAEGQHKCQHAEGQKCQHAEGQHKCQGAEGQHKCQHAEGQKCQHAEGQQKCQGAQGEHKCQHQCQGAQGQQKCQGAQGEHKCQHQCQGAQGQQKCQGAQGEHKCSHQCQGSK